ncbi:MAG: hypothetical protein J1F40_01270 [Prevotellaceae bacterium]|nr:hypothetical protein [Prevotellaceae bacterium]
MADYYNLSPLTIVIVNGREFQRSAVDKRNTKTALSLAGKSGRNYAALVERIYFSSPMTLWSKP